MLGVIQAWIDSAKDRPSTFAADVDTASYTIARRKLTEGMLPPAGAVRVEEFVNYFGYHYAAPKAGSPLAVDIDAAPSPFNKGRQIVRVGVSTKAKSIRCAATSWRAIQKQHCCSAPSGLGSTTWRAFRTQA